jgi:hypothetical protein
MLSAMDDELAWKVVGAGTGLAAGALTRKILVKAWTRTRGSAPPANPAAPRTTWTEALAWAAASGVTLAISKLLAQRAAAGAWRAAKGAYPPGLEAVTP